MSGASDNPADFLQNTTRPDHLKTPPLPSSGSEPPSLKKIFFIWFNRVLDVT